MSTPQDNPNGQGWNAPGASHSGDGGQGRPAPYGQPGTSNYAYQGSDSSQPSQYAYPSQGGNPGQPAKGPAPKEVERAYYLILAAGVLYLISTVLSTLSASSDLQVGGSAFVFMTIALAVVATAIYVVLAVFIRKGHNWARITATVLAALGVLGTLSTLLLLPLTEQMAEASGQPIPETPGLTIALSVIVMLLGVAGVVMTYLKPARPYFKAQPLGY